MMTLLAPTQRKKQDDDDLLIFWDEHTSPMLHGLPDHDGWTWDDDLQLWISDDGTRLSQDDMKHVALQFIKSVERTCRQNTQTMIDGDTTYDAWRQQMDDDLGMEFILLAALADGGLDRITPEDEKAIEGNVTIQPTQGIEAQQGTGLADAQARLEDFQRQIKLGVLSTDQIEARAGKYPMGGYGVYQTVKRNSHQRQADKAPPAETGKPLILWARNLLDPFARHCHDTPLTPGCPSMTRAGWMPELYYVLPGLRTCAAGCRCDTDYVIAPLNADVSYFPGGENDKA